MTLKEVSVLYGSVPAGDLKVELTMAIAVSPRIKYGIFFLARNDDGTFDAVEWDTEVVRDDAGRFVTPIVGRFDPSAWYYPSWLPDDYEQRLKPVSYTARDGWWFSYEYSQRFEGRVEWGRRDENGWLIADRALPLDEVEDWPKFRSEWACSRG